MAGTCKCRCAPHQPLWLMELPVLCSNCISLSVQHGLRIPGLPASLSLSVSNMSAGSHDNPGLSCDGIWAANPKLQNGWFWIDPNEGCKNDSVQVFCNFTTQETCLFPSNTTVGTHCVRVCVCVGVLGSLFPFLCSPHSHHPNTHIAVVRSLVPFSD